jgi:hypothetical protein
LRDDTKAHVDESGVPCRLQHFGDHVGISVLVGEQKNPAGLGVWPDLEAISLDAGQLGVEG